MQKAAAYDKALKDIKAVYPNLKGDVKLAVEHAFPELKESEDEKIVGDIMEAVENWLPCERVEEIRAYLREHKSTEWDREDVHTRFAFYTYGNEPEVLYLSNVFVEESSRNNGIGTLILEAAEKVAETIGATSICLKVKQDSRAAKFYYKNSYNHIIFEGDYEWLEKKLAYDEAKQ